MIFHQCSAEEEKSDGIFKYLTSTCIVVLFVALRCSKSECSGFVCALEDLDWLFLCCKTCKFVGRCGY